MEDVERKRQLIALWLLEQPPEKRTEHDVSAFHAWLLEQRPELLKYGEGDPYQQLKSDLAGYLEDESLGTQR